MASETKYSTTCKQCQKNVFFSSYRFDVNACGKSSCWLRTKKFREHAAQETGQAVEDFLVSIGGKIEMYKDESPPEPQGVDNRKQGYWDHGRWVPWGDGYSD